MDSSFSTSILHLQKRDLYRHEKPYEILFDVSSFGKEAAQTNLRLESCPVRVVDARPSRDGFHLDTNGFEFHEHKTTLGDCEFDDKNLVKERYYPEVERLLRQVLPAASGFLIFHHQVRISITQFA